MEGEARPRTIASVRRTGGLGKCRIFRDTSCHFARFWVSAWLASVGAQPADLEANNRDQAGKNATPPAVNEIFASTAGSAFEGCQGTLGHTFCSWKRSNGHELRIGVINAVQAPYYVADQATFT
jgi:hypothetical protein